MQRRIKNMQIQVNDSTQPLEFWWEAQGEWAEPPNHRRGGVSGVQRVTLPDQQTYYVKRQYNFTFRSLRHPLGAPTLLREWRNLQVCARLGVPTAQAVAFDAHRTAQGQWRAMLVTRALDGYLSLDDSLHRRCWDADTRAVILRAVLDALAPLHRARRKHGHLYGKEVFVRTGDKIDVAFLDLELCRLHVSRRKAAESDLRRLIRSLYVAGLPEQEVRDMLSHQARLGLPMSEAFAARCFRNDQAVR